MSVTTSLDSRSYMTEDPAHPSAHIVKQELFDPDVMKSLLSDERYAYIDRARLKKYYKSRHNPNECRVIYNYGKGWESSQLGRLYPDHGCGLQSFPRDIRNPLTAKYYWDIDIENAHFIIAKKLAEDRGLSTTCFKRYVENRDECLLSVSANRSVAKVAFLKILYGGDIKLYDPNEDEHEEPDGDLGFLVSLKAEVNALMEHIWLECDEIRKHCLRKRNPKASVLSIVLQSVELKLLLALDRCMIEHGRQLDSFIHDGGLVRKLVGEMEFPISLLRCAEDYLLAQTGYVVHLVNKPITHSYDIKTEIIYIAEGVTVEAFRRKKEEFERTHFYLRENGSVCEIRADGTLLMMPVDHATRNMANLVFEFRKEQLIKQIPFFPLWLSSIDRREYDRLVFRPDGVCGDREFNTFLPLRGGSVPVSGDGRVGLARFMEIALNLVKGNEAHREYLMKWIALKLQKPWIIPRVCLVFTGPQGVGKSLFWDFVGSKLIGASQFIVSDNVVRDIFDAHSEAQLSKLFCLMEETSSSVTRSLANELKSKITATKATINPKYVRPFSIDTFMSYVLLTNDASPVKLENGDRRYCIFYTGDLHKGDFSYWLETKGLLDMEETVGSVFDMFMRMDLSGFNPDAFPVSELREIMLDAERSSEESFLMETAGDLSGAEWIGTNQEFYRLYSDWCRKYEMRPKSAVSFGRDLTPFVLKGWVGKWGSHGSYGKSINLHIIRSSVNG